MASAPETAARAVTATLVLLAAGWLAGCSGVFGDSPPHAAPANPVAEGADGQVELTWNAVTDADSYVILWSDGSTPGGALTNVIGDITGTSFVHSGLTNLRTYSYRIAAVTGGGRGPESITVTAEPGPVPGPVEWAAVTAQDPGHMVHFATATQATGYRIYFSGSALALSGRRPNSLFEIATASPHVRTGIAVNAAVFYRVIAMNGSRIGSGGPVVISPAHSITTSDLPRAGLAFGDPNDDDCLDLVTATGGRSNNACDASFAARVLADVGLGDLLAAPRISGDSRFADFSGDGRDDLFSNTASAAGTAGSVALLHVNNGTGNYQTSASTTALGIGGFGGTVFAADFDNDGDVDLFAPNDHTQGDGARNWLLMNDGGGNFTDAAAAAGVDGNPAGAAFVPRGGQAVDFDEDGFVDLVFGSRLLLNDGDGTFSDASVAVSMPVRGDHGLKLIDVDLDGDFDLVHLDGAVVRLYRNDGGSFDAGTIVAEDTTQAVFGRGLNVCDVNSDGFEDVLFARNAVATDTGTPRLLVNVDGQLLPSAVPNGLAAANDLIAHNDLIACADLDASGVTDVMARWGTTYRLMRANSPLSTRIRIRVLGAGSERNQQGRVVRITPQDQPNRVMIRVVESGSGLQSQGQYDLLVGAPWPGEYDIEVRFAAGTVTATADAGDDLTIFADGRVVAGLQ
ncbi:MAG: FG-GAP-like repeat-containing protein [Gammaproteobacteria bacterium]